MQSILGTAGPQAAHIEALWWLTFGVCLAVFPGVLAAFAMALRHGSRGGAPGRGAHLWVAGAVGVSTVLLLVLIFASTATDRALAGLPLDNALRIQVTANQWWWSIRYEDPQPSRMFTTANEITIPVGRPVAVTLKSNDVIHSFWVPNLSGKKDLVPGRTATLVFRADRPGTYRGQCAEFCGHQHAKMALLVTALPPQAYERWAQAQRRAAAPPETAEEKRGFALFMQGRCATCHTIAGTPAFGRLGPDLTHLASRKTLAAGTLPNRRGDLAGWIVDPHSVKPGVRMPANALSPDDLNALLAYLQTLQ